jgi:hypothetical protein
VKNEKKYLKGGFETKRRSLDKIKVRKKHSRKVRADEVDGKFLLKIINIGDFRLIISANIKGERESSRINSQSFCGITIVANSSLSCIRRIRGNNYGVDYECIQVLVKTDWFAICRRENYSLVCLFSNIFYCPIGAWGLGRMPLRKRNGGERTKKKKKQKSVCVFFTPVILYPY